MGGRHQPNNRRAPSSFSVGVGGQISQTFPFTCGASSRFPLPPPPPPPPPEWLISDGSQQTTGLQKPMESNHSHRTIWNHLVPGSISPFLGKYHSKQVMVTGKPLGKEHMFYIHNGMLKVHATVMSLQLKNTKIVQWNITICLSSMWQNWDWVTAEVPANHLPALGGWGSCAHCNPKPQRWLNNTSANFRNVPHPTPPWTWDWDSSPDLKTFTFWALY